MKITKKWKMGTGALMLAMALMLAGCSSNGDPATDADGKAKSVVNVVIAAPYVSEEAAETYKNQVLVPAAGEGVSVNLVCVSMGDDQSDPMGTVAGMTRFTAMVASSEMDLLICDRATAVRHGENGELFTAMADAFSPEELNAFSKAQTTIPVKDDESNDTGEVSAECGVSLSGDEKLKPVTGVDMEMYIVSNAVNADSAKAVFKALAK